MGSNKKIHFLIVLFFISTATLKIQAQSFTLVTNNANPIVTTPPPSGYSGASWIDYNNDNYLDLFINNNHLFKNNGNGTFSRINSNIGQGAPITTGSNGNTWADVDNDGDLDVYITGSLSYLYLNDGSDSFSRVNSGDIADGPGNRGWAGAFGDYDNDGLVDLAIAHPGGFFGSPLLNHLFKNNGNGDFTKIANSPISTGFQPYTVGSWSDFDNDGDLDYSVGAGPASNFPGFDYWYRNQLTETGSATFERITSGPASVLRDGQIWNWIDYDNDGDLDLYITNWGDNRTPKGLPNDLYRNDNGNFTKIIQGAIVTTRRVSLASVWADFDNDGDLDCYVSNDNGSPDSYYENNGDGTFTSLPNTEIGVLVPNNKRSASAGDYDNDGKVDLITIGSNLISLYHNNFDNDNNWVSIKLEGRTSNRSGIGAKVRLKAEIFGESFWQMREISAQNSFNAQNDLRAHFGLGDAQVVDSLIIEWPSGQIDTKADFHLNDFWHAIEGEGITTVVTDVEDFNELPKEFSLEQNYPNPFNPSTIISYTIPSSETHQVSVQLKVYDILGNEVATLVNEQQPAGSYNVEFNAQSAVSRLSSGIYFYRLQAGNNIITKKMSLLK